MIEIDNKESCCGCGACAAICAKGAITMQPDGLGFVYPQVNKTLCNDCGLCDRVCAFNTSYDVSSNLDQADVYASRNKDVEILEKSTSGGAFTALSDWTLRKGGVVYGVGYEDHFRVVHKRAVNSDQRDEFRGSKYVQSDLGDSFCNIRDDLKAGYHVMFSGTPCQTSGLISYLNILKIDVEKLLVCDIVCHGVPSPYYWRDYLQYIEDKVGQVVTGVNFRDKSRGGWSTSGESLYFDKKRYKASNRFYHNKITFRRSCSICPFTNLRRPSDITIADYWGWKSVVDESFNADDKGISLILVNTTKGREVFEGVNKYLDCIKTDVGRCLQPNLQHPSPCHPKKDEFERDYINHGYVYACKKHGVISWKNILKRVVITILNKLRSITK